MTNLFDFARQQQQRWSVADLTRYIREMFEVDFRLQDVEVEGEISNFTRARSGHLYFTLKDGKAQLKGVMWRGSAQRLRFAPSNGDQVIAHGKVGVYDAGGVYQLYVDRLQPAGRGNLAIAFEQLKERLNEEGLFNPDFKQPIPALPKKIGIVTSADAAALRDILNVLRRRYPLVEVLIAPTLVQGETAPPQIVAALQQLDRRADIDTILLSRGGGSLEDLWAFNDENVARAIFSSRTPIISGVGHEVDFTIADFVADLRAPTPSAAAELAVPNIADLRLGIQGLQNTLDSIMRDRLGQLRQQVENMTRMLGNLTPEKQLRNNGQRLDELTRRLESVIRQTLREKTNHLQLASANLHAFSPQATLDRGYAIVRDGDGRVVKSAETITINQPLTVRVADGEFDVRTMKKQ